MRKKRLNHRSPIRLTKIHYAIIISYFCTLYSVFQGKLRLKFIVFYPSHRSFPTVIPDMVRYSEPQANLSYKIKRIRPNRLKKVMHYDLKFPYQEQFVYPQNFDKERLPLVLVDHKYNGSQISFFVETLFSEQADIFELPNGYVGFMSSFVGNFVASSTNVIDMYGDTTITPKLLRGFSRKRYHITGVRYALAPIYKWSYVFAHWVTDAIGALLNVPEWIWNLKPVLVVSQTQIPLIKEYMKIIGHSDLRFILTNNTCVFAEHLFVIRGRGIVHPFGSHAMRLLREKLRDYYGLRGIQSTVYGYMNKESWRRFINMDDIIDDLKKIKNVDIINYSVNEPDRISFARSMAGLKLLICPCGSLAFNMIFMNSGSGLLTLNADIMDGPNLKLSAELGIWHLQIIHSNMGHFGKPGYGSLSKTDYGFDIIHYAIQNNRWPSHKLFSPFNFSYMETRKDIHTLKFDAISPDILYLYKQNLGFEIY